MFNRTPKEQRRVVVTGMGALSPLGLSVTESWEKAINAQSGIGKIESFDTENYAVKFAGEVKGFDPEAYVSKKDIKKMDRFIPFCLAATDMAIKDSGLDLDKINLQRVGTLIGVGLGGLPYIEQQHQVLMERGPSRLSPFFIPSTISNLAPGHVSMKYGFQGPNFTVTSACASGAHAIGEAAKYIRDGHCDVMIAGGSESVVCGMAIGGFAAMKALSTRNDSPQTASRPFDKTRDGFVLSEGAATLILEDYEVAKKRGAKIYAEVLGYGLSSDAYHMTSPAPEGRGAALAMRVALEDAEINPEDIQYINAHGTSTPAGDELESMAVESVFGDHAKKLWMSSTKGVMGHSLGAAGAIESVFSIMALHTGVVPPTANLETPDENCRLDYVPGAAREKALSAVLNNSFGFGGTNCSLIFSKI
ncbi:MAG: beta-ketoacyl-ACP synthase II [Bdellovibrionaceae bacterium]|nr:beta-ketoacyl-ACP synthase II [Pseudobdellovibrionaceae bacterium]